MIVVSDTSPLNYLVLIGEVRVLPALFGRVVVPAAVMLELGHDRAPQLVRTFTSSPPGWLEVRTVKLPVRDPRLGPGESEAIALACELRAETLLIDDRDARHAAQQAGLIRLDQSLDKLSRTSFRVSPSQVEAALARDAARKPNPE